MNKLDKMIVWFLVGVALLVGAAIIVPTGGNERKGGVLMEVTCKEQVYLIPKPDKGINIEGFSKGFCESL